MVNEAHLEPLTLLLGQHDLLDHLRLYRYDSETLKTKPDVTVELALGLRGRQQSEMPVGSNDVGDVP